MRERRRRHQAAPRRDGMHPGRATGVASASSGIRVRVASLPFRVKAPESQANHRRDTMGTYCLLESVPSHRASVGEILEVRWVDYYGAVIFGDRNEIACIPHEGCRLEITATAPSPHRKAEPPLPGQVRRYMHSLFLGDRFVLPNGRKVKLQHLVGFKLQLASRPGPLPLED